MTPGKINGATRILGKPDSMTEEECSSLPVRDTWFQHLDPPRRVMQSAWYPTRDELEKLKAGEPIIVSVFGSSHPAIALEVPGNEMSQLEKLI